MKLSILIPTLPERQLQLNKLLQNISIQSIGRSVEVLIDDRPRGITTGAKRNDLISRSIADYVWFIDDDDEINSNAIPLIFAGLNTNPDVITYNGYMTTNGRKHERFNIRLGNPYKKHNGIYLRYPNHICPMKRDLIKDIKFPNVYHGEDYTWATEINDKAILKTEYFIPELIYHYKFIQHK